MIGSCREFMRIWPHHIILHLPPSLASCYVLISGAFAIQSWGKTASLWTAENKIWRLSDQGLWSTLGKKEQKGRQEDTLFIFDYVCATRNFLGNAGDPLQLRCGGKDRSRQGWFDEAQIEVHDHLARCALNRDAHQMGTQVDMCPTKGDDHPESSLIM